MPDTPRPAIRLGTPESLDPPERPADPFEPLKTLGRDLLLSLACERCQLRRRTSFGWVLEVCGLCARHQRVVPVNDATSQWVGDRFNARLLDLGWDRCPVWALRYLADGPKPVPWASIQLAGQTGNPDPAAPLWAVQLLHLGTPMKSYVKRTGSIAVKWPEVFRALALDDEIRNAVSAALLLGREGGATGRYGYTDDDCARVYEMLLERNDALFGGASQENTRLIVRSPR